MTFVPGVYIHAEDDAPLFLTIAPGQERRGGRRSEEISSLPGSLSTTNYDENQYHHTTISDVTYKGTPL